MSATNQDVIDEVNSLKGFHDQVIADVVSAKDAAIAAAAAANLENPKAKSNVIMFLGGPNADDANDASTLTAPVATLNRLLNLMPTAANVIVRILGDFNVDGSVNVNSPPPKLTIQGWDPVSNSAASNAFTRTGIGRFYFGTNCEFVIKGFGLDIGGASSNSVALVAFQGANGTLVIEDTPITKTGDGILVSYSAFLDFDISNSPLGAGVPGSLISGVAANADPNNTAGVRSTSTSA